MRDRRLDFWRGLCLVDMVLVHLVWEGLYVGRVLTALIGEYTRFAAGGFVFVAGIGVGLVFLPRTKDPRQRWVVYGDLWRRASYLLGVHYAATASFLALDALRWGTPSADAMQVLRNVLTFREAPPYGDILPLYVMLLVLAPGLLELLRRRLWPLVVLASAVLFAVGQQHPWVLSPRVPEPFPLVLWQAVFVAGLLFGATLPRLDRASRPALLATTSLAALAYAGVTLTAHAAALGLSVPTSITFQKTPLSGGELLRYLATTLVVVLGTALMWRRLERRTLTQFVETIGRRALAVYVAHVWVQAAVMELAWGVTWMGDGQVLLAPIALVALGAVAYGLEATSPRGVTRLRLTTALRRGGALPGGAVVAALLIVTLPLTGPGPSPNGREAGVEAAEVVADLDGAEASLQMERVDPDATSDAPESPALAPDTEPRDDDAPEPLKEEARGPALSMRA